MNAIILSLLLHAFFNLNDLHLFLISLIILNLIHSTRDIAFIHILIQNFPNFHYFSRIIATSLFINTGIKSTITKTNFIFFIILLLLSKIYSFIRTLDFIFLRFWIIHSMLRIFRGVFGRILQ